MHNSGVDARSNEMKYFAIYQQYSKINRSSWPQSNYTNAKFVIKIWSFWDGTKELWRIQSDKYVSFLENNRCSHLESEKITFLFLFFPIHYQAVFQRFLLADAETESQRRGRKKMQKKCLLATHFTWVLGRIRMLSPITVHIPFEAVSCELTKSKGFSRIFNDHICFLPLVQIEKPWYTEQPQRTFFSIFFCFNFFFIRPNSFMFMDIFQIAL